MLYSRTVGGSAYRFLAEGDTVRCRLWRKCCTEGVGCTLVVLKRRRYSLLRVQLKDRAGAFSLRPRRAAHSLDLKKMSKRVANEDPNASSDRSGRESVQACVAAQAGGLSDPPRPVFLAAYDGEGRLGSLRFAVLSSAQVLPC